jgi:hypothetical protein
MKISRIQAAVASVLALAASQAFAAPLTSADVDGTVVQLRFGGATATDNALQNLLKLASGNGGLCVDNTLSLYSKDKTILGFCTASANAGTVSGKKITIQKESNGGSANGIIPLATQSTVLQFLTVDTTTLAACEGTANANVTTKLAAGDFAQYNVVACPTAVSTTGIAPNVGVSDIDPTTFTGLGGVTAAHVSKLTSESTVAVTFNPIVSLKFRNALQAAQGLTSGSDALADMPTLTLAQLRAIFTGSITDISNLYSIKPSTGLEVRVDSTSAPISICRRGDTSGTMASFKILFLGEGCSKNAASIGAFLTPDAVYNDAVQTTLVTNPNGGNTFSSTATIFDAGGTQLANGWGDVAVFPGASSGEVRKCVAYNSANRYAIGTVSTEYNPFDTTNNTVVDLRYVKVEGAEPTLHAVITGRYPYFTENTFNRVKTGQPGVIAGDPLALYNAVKGQMGKPTVINNNNFGWRDGAGSTADAGRADVGILDLPVIGSNDPTAQPVSFASVRTKPINAQQRNYTGTANNCNMSRFAR